jgi:hypothetical protein
MNYPNLQAARKAANIVFAPESTNTQCWVKESLEFKYYNMQSWLFTLYATATNEIVDTFACVIDCSLECEIA